nr:hypothetical protein [Allomuricauda sp.]
MWEQEKIDNFYLRSERIIEEFPKEEAFRKITLEIDRCEVKYLNEYIVVLNQLQYGKVLDWIETGACRAKNVSENWGHLAASSNFGWERANKWLTMGRPLSLISLDALLYCTTLGERLNQSLWMREIQPQLEGHIERGTIAVRLQEF